MGLPVVATRIPGCVDAVQEGVTGILVPPRESAALEAALRAYLRDETLRRRHGEAGRARVLRDFRQETIWQALLGEYGRLLRARGLHSISAASVVEEAAVQAVATSAIAANRSAAPSEDRNTVSPSYR